MCVTRKLTFILAAIVLPGGLLALFGALLVRALSRTERGKRVVQVAERRVRAIRFAVPAFSVREAA